MFKIGDIVRFLDENGEGKITKVLGSSIFEVENEFGFTSNHSARELIKVNENHDFHLNIEHAPIKGKKNSKDNTTKKNTQNKTSLPEIDLHFDAIAHKVSGFSIDTELVQQMNYLRRKMSSFKEKGIKDYVIIHGVGKGILRREVIHELQKFDKIEFWDASYDEFGAGAIRVKFY